MEFPLIIGGILLVIALFSFNDPNPKLFNTMCWIAFPYCLIVILISIFSSPNIGDIKPSQVWVNTNASPFEEVSPNVTVIDKKDGWVLVQKSDNSRESVKINTFLSLYKKLD